MQGATPEISTNGTWVINGIDTGVIASPSLAGYATEEYVTQEIAKLPKVDLSFYVTQKEFSEALLGI